MDTTILIYFPNEKIIDFHIMEISKNMRCELFLVRYGKGRNHAIRVEIFFNLSDTHTIKLKATFGAGCFWHVEDLLSKTKGVKSTVAGYIGGQTPNPTYEDVCTNNTGHAEAVQIEYDPDEISYEKLLDIFWSNHNPTTLNRQGPDVGTQYRSAIFYHDEKQKEIAVRSRRSLDESKRHRDPIVTEITQAPAFYAAEEYHQKYFKKRGFS